MKGGDKMKKIFLFAVLSFAILGLVQAIETSDSMTVSTDIVGDQIGVQVTESVDFGSISKGTISPRQDINITNTGTVNIEVTPELSENYTGDIFDYLSFQRVLSDPKKMVGNFSVTIDKPSEAGGIRTQKVYMYLDLTEYPGNIEGDIQDHQAEVIFWATSI